MRSRRQAEITVSAGGWAIFMFFIGIIYYLLGLWLQSEINWWFTAITGTAKMIPIWATIALILLVNLVTDKGLLLWLVSLSLSLVCHVFI